MGGSISELKPLEFEWDEGNRDKNWERHRVEIKECEEAFFNEPLRLLYDVVHSQKEDRFTALGRTNKGRKLFITFTVRGGRIRVISARDMSRKERRLYEEKH